MNISKILFHNIQWFLREFDTSLLTENWEEEIQNTIIKGCSSGEFSVEILGNMDSLIWEIIKV